MRSVSWSDEQKPITSTWVTWRGKATWTNASGNHVETAMDFKMPSTTSAVVALHAFIDGRELGHIVFDSLEIGRLP